ncbi:MAG: hypothetical protein NC489_12700 [Ruminococcus flavefaciens]|nr:hypothetical protein [Ruminococcus flavefaciens]
MAKDKYELKIREIMYLIYSLVTVFCAYLTLKVLAGQISESIRMLSYILCIYSLKKQKENRAILRKEFREKWQKFLVMLLEMYAAFSMTGMYILTSTVEYEENYSKAAFLACSFLWVRPVALQFLALLVRMPEKIELSSNTIRFKDRILLIIITILPCIIFLIGFNPAITSPDSESCFAAAHKLWQPTFAMKDWHPPFYVFILNLLTQVCDSVTFVIVVQVIYFAIVFVDGILFLYQRGFSKRLVGTFYVFITFGISNIIQLITLWKDIPYMISLMWLTLLLIKIFLEPDINRIKWSWCIQFVFSVIFTAFFRQNGILPALAVILLVPIALKFSKKIIMLSGICLFLILIIKGPLYKAMNVNPVPQLKFFSLSNDMMYPYYQGCEVPDDVMEIINKITDNDPDHFKYDAYYVTYNRDEPKGYSVFEFLRIYGKAFIQNPMDMTMALLIRNTDIWSIIRPHDERPGCVNYTGEVNRYSPNIYPYRNENVLTEKLTDFCNWIRDNSILYIFYWRTGIYNLLIIFILVILICRQKEIKMYKLMPFIPIVMNLSALFITSGWSDYRYFWPGMTISIFLVFYYVMLCPKLPIIEKSC